MICRNRILLPLAYVILVGMLTITASAYAQSIDSIRIIKLSPAEDTLVIKLDDSEMKIIRVGDIILDAFKLAELSENRAVFDNIRSKIGERIIIRMENGEQKMERLTLLPETASHYYQTVNTNESKEK